VLEYAEASAPLDEESLKAAELDREQAEIRSPRGILRASCVLFPVTAALLFIVIYLLGGLRLIVPETLPGRYPGEGPVRFAERVEEGERGRWRVLWPCYSSS